MRTPFIAGNWKMHKTIAEGVSLAIELRANVNDVTGVDIAVCPTFTALSCVAQALKGSNIAVGAQDIYWEESGAFTGEISPAMLLDAGCTYVIAGHSERRGRFGEIPAGVTDEHLSVFGDNDVTVNRKAQAALAAGLLPIVCCGELLSERDDGKTDDVVRLQVERALQGFAANEVAKLVIAYEPVWAIGTGRTCEPEEANRVCGIIRTKVAELAGDDVAAGIRVQYGGSVKPANIDKLIAQEHIDGALVGGASLKADDFAAIVRAAAA